MTERELRRLNRLVSAFFDLAEEYAEEHHPMYMKDWIEQLDDFAERYGNGVLEGAGNISHKQAIKKARQEYDIYQSRIAELPTSVDRDYFAELQREQKRLNGEK
nr:virulence RhuM family protein [Xiamenia xianingshaonis]